MENSQMIIMLILLVTSRGLTYLLGDLYGFKRGVEKAKEIYTR